MNVIKTVALCLLLALLGCATPSKTPVTQEPVKTDSFLKDNAMKEGVVTLPSGLQYRVIKQGEGISPERTDQVTVHYRGTLVDGTEFDSSYKRNQPSTFPVNRVIPGWTEALQLMREGDQWQLFIPSNLAYGPRGNSSIGPNKTLIFDVELIKVISITKNKKKGQAFLTENAKQDGVTTLPSGLQYKVLTSGTGKSPRSTDKVTVHYRGTLIDGIEFDSSFKRNKTVTFPVNGVIKGWTEALQLMHEGDKWQLYIPSNLAYGPSGTGGGKIGPYETLLFEVELIKVN